MEQDELVRLLMSERLKLLAYIWTFVRHDQVAEDVFQEVSIQAVKSQAKIVDEAHFLAWLRRVARNLCMNALRANHRQAAQLDEDLLETLESEWASYDRNTSLDLVESLKQCVEGLTPGNRQLIAMRFGEDLRGEALANRVGRKINAVHVALSRIYRALAECMRQRLIEEGI